AAGQTGTGTTGNYRDAALMAELEQGFDLLDALGQHHQHRRGAIGGKAVALVWLEIFEAMQDFQVGKLRLQLGQQRGLIHLGQLAVDAFVVKNIHGSRVLSLFTCSVQTAAECRIISPNETWSPPPEQLVLPV